MASLPSIDLDIPEKLKDIDYRHEFFLAEASANIARQLITIRKLRNLSQKDLADLVGTKQSGISRVESADYNNWSFNTLRKIAEVLDARIRVEIEPSELVLRDYAEPVSNDSAGVLASNMKSIADQRLPSLTNDKDFRNAGSVGRSEPDRFISNHGNDKRASFSSQGYSQGSSTLQFSKVPV